ncbi:hypothetical protein EIO60_00028|nr:hypothetical protein [Candidatus Pantoea persica]
MKFFFFVSLIAAAGYLMAFLPKLRTKLEPVAYWGCWSYLTANAVHWSIYGLRFISIFNCRIICRRSNYA